MLVLYYAPEAPRVIPGSIHYVAQQINHLFVEGSNKWRLNRTYHRLHSPPGKAVRLMTCSTIFKEHI